MAHHQLAQRHERKAQGSFCCCPRAGCRRTTAADPGQRSATSAWGGGLAHRRTQDVRREEILSRQPAGEDRPAHLSRHHQGTLDLRAGSPAAERRTRSRSLRGAILARASPSRAYDNDRLRLPPAPPSRNSEAEKKESTARRLSQLCPPCATQSSNSSLDCRRSDARIVENGCAPSGGGSKSAKVVLVRLNNKLAWHLGLDPGKLAAPEGVEILAGNRVPERGEPLAMAYAGHQFGTFVPQLGDGRAILLGEVIDRDGVRRDIQLKGSGPTPFSRRGDGPAPLGPVLREYIVSEAMAALGIPTTRAFAAVTTGEPVWRETPLPGAVLTRVASSHIRVGTFQFFAARNSFAKLSSSRRLVFTRSPGFFGISDGATTMHS